VENSITHGLSDKNQINIFIQGRCTDEKVELSVSDDGKGMSGEALEQLRQSLLLEKKSSSHIGLWNVNRRIKLVYEDAYGIRVESAVKAGTTVRITLPKNGKGQKEL
jgi:sensor histidine kinase YesM